jgi:RimJ/RimL family protein N-acetyltransferase
LPESYVIRAAAPRDAGALVALAEDVAAEPEGWLISDGGWRTVGDERRYLRTIRRYRDAAVFVAEAEGEIVGRLSLGRDPHPASRHVADLGLMVAAGARRKGIGRALLQQSVEWARGVGVRKLELHVFPHNEAAIALYEDFGFRREGYRKAHYRRGAGYVDAILMAYDVH